MNWNKWLPAALVVVVAAAGGYLYWQRLNNPDLPDGIVATNGRIEAERIDVSTKYAGRIAKVLVSEGDWVEEGALVAQIDADDVRAQLDQAKASVTQAEQGVRQAQAELELRKSALELAQLEHERAQTLLAKGHATQETADERRTALNVAKAAVASAEAAVDQARAAIASAEASVRQLETTLADADLVAPRAGRVQYVLAQAGEVVGAGGRVVTLTDLSDVYMTVFLPAAAAGRLAIGAQARIVLDPVPEYVIPATVTFVSSTAQFTPKSVETDDEREQLMFRVKLTIAPELLERYRDRAKAGVAGIGYVQVDPAAQWPEHLEVSLPQ